MRKLITSVVIGIMLMSSQVHAQGPVVTRVNTNNGIKTFLKKHPHFSWGDRSHMLGITDTLQLPFFEDFTSTEVYPDEMLWIDNKVYVNSTLPLLPPTFGVATFDNLDPQGNPYFDLDTKVSSISDFLTSQPINLNFDSLNLVSYTPQDSIIFSFYFQSTGNGDRPELEDSLVLQFKDQLGFWNTVWEKAGGSSSDFNQAIVPIEDTSYLHGDFQFRFYNRTKNTGNMNHWHVDYIRLKADRSVYDTAINEVAMFKKPSSLLSNYYSMPYDQFLADTTKELADSHWCFARNNDWVTANVTYNYEAFDKDNNIIDSFTTISDRNIVLRDDTTEVFDPISLGNLSGDQPFVRLSYSVKSNSLGRDKETENYGANNTNNEISSRLEFNNYLAYDDGSAEGGFGLDYGSLPPGDGYVAYKFHINKYDTIWGTKIFFNQSVKDVSNIPFTFYLWKEITATNQSHMNDDSVIYVQTVSGDIHEDTINGFHSVYFDSAQILDSGYFYIGWLQKSDYIINIGYDKNYRYQGQGGTNKNLFFNMLGFWEPVSSDIKGALMMRPILGREKDLAVSTYEVPVEDNKIIVYPNPVREVLNISLDEENIGTVQIFDVLGRLQMVSESNKIDVSHLKAGKYFVRLWNNNMSGYKYNTFIKLD